MKLMNILGGLFSVLLLAGCATDPSNDPHSGGFFGGVRGLASGDYEARQQRLQDERGQTYDELRALRNENESLETTRQMKANEVAAQRRQLASLKARNREMAKRIDSLQRSKQATDQRTVELRRQQQQLTRNIQQFEKELELGRMSASQAETKRLSLERQYDAINAL